MSAKMGSKSEQDGGEREILAAVDDIDGQPHLVVADVTRDGAWLAVTEGAGASLSDWE